MDEWLVRDRRKIAINDKLKGGRSSGPRQLIVRWLLRIGFSQDRPFLPS
jgi:hypothetical protein